MIVIKLREAMHAFHRRTGIKLTYASLAELSGVSESTVEAMGGRLGYNTTLSKLENVPRALGVSLLDLLEVIDDAPKPNRKLPKRKRNTK